MPLVINTNISSLNAQRQLVASGNDLSDAMERLSSGLRINSAADDAAGLAISNRMTSQIRGLNQAVRNGNDGVSMIQTAEGALDETTNILQRIRELAIQSANGIYSDSDRATLDAEVQQLKEELDRIANSTTFNGQILLDGSLGEVKLQVGAQAGQTITMNIPAMDVKTLGGTASGDIVGMSMTVDPDNITLIDGADPTTSMFINKQNVGDLVGATNMKELLDLFEKNVSGVETRAFTEVLATGAGTGILRGNAIMELTLFQPDGSQNVYQIGDTGSMKELAERITDITGGLIKGELDDDGQLIMSNPEGAAIGVRYANTTADSTGIPASPGGVPITIADAYQATLSFTSKDDKGITIEYGTAVAANAAELGVNARSEAGDISGLDVGAFAEIPEGALLINGVSLETVPDGLTVNGQAIALRDAINAKSSEHGVVADLVGDSLTLNSVSGKEISVEYGQGAPANILALTGLLETNSAASVGNAVADISVSTVEGATAALKVVDIALETINDTRAQMGAVANRLEFTMSNIMNVVENTEASRSRIMDADFAAESAELSRAQVLQQASQAMLAQANAKPQQVLQLLQS